MRKVPLIAGGVCIVLAILIVLSTVIWHDKIFGHGPVVLEPLKVAPRQGSNVSGQGATQQGTTASNAFVTLPPGSVLPSEQECSTRINHSAAEPRTDNETANHAIPTQQQIAQLAPWGDSIGATTKADQFRKQITGNFTGTTGEILQWVACKWGVDENIVLAEAVIESDWHQNFLGDYTNDKKRCPPGQWDGSGCYQSYGVLQLTYTFFPTAWPMSRNNTAFSAEYVYGVIRTCYEGWTSYLAERKPLPGYSTYRAGDLWGCLGMWFSGGWYDSGAINYIDKVKKELVNKNWQESHF